MNLTLRQKTENILARVYDGLHHVNMNNLEDRGYYITFLTSKDLSTFDFDLLTRLVIAAHDECVRVSIQGRSYRFLHLVFHDRKREGSFADRHPTIEQALEKIRNNKKFTLPHKRNDYGT